MSNVTLLVESVRAAHTYNLLLSESYAHPTSTLSQSSYSFVDPSVPGSRLYETKAGEIILIQKSPTDLIAEKLMGPLVIAVAKVASTIGGALSTSLTSAAKFCFTSAPAHLSSFLSRVDRALSFPTAEAAKALPKRVVDAIDTFSNAFLTEEMLVRIYKNQYGTDIEPKAASAVKIIFNYIGSLTDPTDFVQIFQDQLEPIARPKMQELASVLKKQKAELEKNEQQKKVDKLIEQQQNIRAQLIRQRDQARVNPLAMTSARNFQPQIDRVDRKIQQLRDSLSKDEL